MIYSSSDITGDSWMAIVLASNDILDRWQPQGAAFELADDEFVARGDRIAFIDEPIDYPPEIHTS